MMRWENGLSSGWSLCDSDKKMEPPGALNTLSAKGLSASAISLGASLEYSTSTLLIVCTPQKFIQTLAGGTISPRRGFTHEFPLILQTNQTSARKLYYCRIPTCFVLTTDIFLDPLYYSHFGETVSEFMHAAV